MNEDVYISEPVAQVLSLYDGLVDETAWDRAAGEQVEILADRLLTGHETHHPGAAVELLNWLPKARGLTPENLFALPLSRVDALESVSRGHGFADWNVAASDGCQRGDPDFERAVEDVLAGDIATLTASLARVPQLVYQRSHYGHRATLLHYLAANGVEIYRQRVPYNAATIASLLLERGADPRATANMYGGRATMRGMLISSAHPHAAGVTQEILAVLDHFGGSRGA